MAEFALEPLTGSDSQPGESQGYSGYMAAGEPDGSSLFVLLKPVQLLIPLPNMAACYRCSIIPDLPIVWQP